MIYAGFWVRLLAHLIDFVMLNALELALEYGIATPTHMDPVVQQIMGICFSVIITYVYYCRYQVKHGTTVGKRLFDIYVIDEKTGEFLSHKQAMVRTFGYLISYAIVGCGFLMAAFHPRKKGLHDIMAGTVSVRVPKALNSIDSVST